MCGSEKMVYIKKERKGKDVHMDNLRGLLGLRGIYRMMKEKSKKVCMRKRHRVTS